MKKSNLKRYGINQKDIAKWFGYSSQFTFNSSSAKDRILSGIEKLIEQIENEIVSKITG